MAAPIPEPPEQAVTAGRLLRSTSVVGAMTLLSRVLGMVRDIVFARVFGASIVMDAFFVAFKIPNIFRRFFAEGAFSQAFVPVLSEYETRQSRAEVRELVDRVAGTLAVVLFGVTLVGVIAAPVLVLVFAPGFIAASAEDAGRYELATAMLRWTFPYLFFISLVALAGAILNTRQRFAVPAFSPVLLNLMLIVFAALVAPNTAQPGITLAIGVFVAGLVQLVCMVPFLAGAGGIPRPRWGLAHDGVRRILRLMAPALFGSSVAQISILFDTLIASFLVVGSISWLYYSDRLMEFPLGVFGIALATVILPSLSRQHAAADPAAFSRTLDWALRLVILIAAPAATGLCLLAGPMLATIFYGGRFGIEDTEMARLSLIAYGTGLLGFTLVKVLVPGYFARQDTRSPVRIGVIALGANMALNIALVLGWLAMGWPGAHAALALATSLSAFLNAGLLWRGLVRGGVLVPEPGWGRFLLRVGVACGVMALVLTEATPAGTLWYGETVLTRVTWLSGLIAAGALTYFATLVAVGMRSDVLRMKSGGGTL